MHGKNWISIAKAVVLASALMVMVTILHLNFAIIPMFSNQPERTLSPTQKTDVNEHQPPSPSQAPVPELKSTDDLGVTLQETQLTRTVRFRNGTLNKIFKPKFFTHPCAAKEEMGSFMLTLARQSWRDRLVSDARGYESVNCNNTCNINNNNNNKKIAECHEKNSTATSKRGLGRYFAYLPMGGGNNQFLALQKAALVAKDLNRTLLLPPISPNQHVPTWAGPRYSEFYDLETFMTRSGISVIEWHDIKQTPESIPRFFKRHWQEFAEDFPCIPNGRIGHNDNGTDLFDRFRQQFLFNYKKTIPQADKTFGKSTNYKFAVNVLLRDTLSSSSSFSSEEEVGTSSGGIDPNMWRCLTSPYFLHGREMFKRPWEEIGLHLRFNNRTEALVDDILDVLLGSMNDEKTLGQKAGKKEEDKDKSVGCSFSRRSSSTPFRPHPEFIAIHLRRGDIVSKCPPGVTEKDCVVQIEAIANKVEEIEKKRRTEAWVKYKKHDDVNMKKFVHKRLPVLVATNEKRKEELSKVERLGWILLDHGDEETKGVQASSSRTIKLGTQSRFGPWYPPILDAVLLTRAKYMIGMRNSVMSSFAKYRGEAWHGHRGILM